MGNQPWLDSLSEDWVSLPGSPTSPVPGQSSVNHSRRSSLHSLHSLQNTPSRIPVPARRSAEPSPTFDPKKKVTRPCHFIKREPPTPKTPRTPKTPSKLRSPAPDKTKKSPQTTPPKPTPSSRRKPQPAMDGRSPLRSVSNVSSQSGQQSTVQIRPKKGSDKESTPEWRKRLVKGEIPSGEQRDLFAPIGLESVFKPPTPGSPRPINKALPKVRQAHNLWDLSTSPEEKKVQDGDRNNSSARKPKKPVSKQRAGSKNQEGSKGSQAQNLGVKKRREEPKSNSEESRDDFVDDTQLRSASGLEDLRNEDITPITFSRTNTVEGMGASEVIRSALKPITNKLERLNLGSRERPGSRASDSVLLNQPGDLPVDAVPEDDLLDVTSHSLPQDLSMGTLDYRGRGAFFPRLHPDPYLDDRSFQKGQFSSAAFPSQRFSPFMRPTPRIRSSPPFYHKTNPVTDPPTLPRPSSAHAKVTVGDDSSMDKSEVITSSGSPLKLFGYHDTFTNNKLLRRMSQFEETFNEFSDDEDDAPVSPSEEARRKGEFRSILNVKQDPLSDNNGRRYERPKSQNNQTPRLNRFGEGHLDDFDFSDTSPYDPKLLDRNTPEPSFPQSSQSLSVEGRYLRRRSYRRTSRDSEAHKGFRPSRSTTWSEAESAGNTGISQASARDNDGGFNLSLGPHSPGKDPMPKRRRTVIRAQSPKKEGASLGEPHSELTDDLSLLQRSLMQHGLKYDEDGFLVSQSSIRPRTPTPHQSRSAERTRSSPSRSRTQHEGNDHEDLSPLLQGMPTVVINGVHEEVRKGSITTQDFLNEATKIMDIIRSKGKATGGLSSVEESDMEGNFANESYEDESTREEFSRPPSREGVDMRKLRVAKEPSPRILSHLKKFQEQDDVEFGVLGSVMSLHLKDKHKQNRLDNSSDLRSASSDARKRKFPVPSMGDDETLYDILRFNTITSAKTFSTRSIPTGSSQSSHAKGVLSSDIVSHLIPEQVNGLTYDRSKHQWVKEDAKESTNTQKGDDAEDDPFRDIPDLSVDELQEMMRTSSPEKSRDTSTADDQSPVSTKSMRTGLEYSSQPKDGAPPPNVSSIRSKESRSNSSVPNSGTRETSWGTNSQKSAVSSTDVEHEIKLHEGRLSKPPQNQANMNHRARVVTISFSSPLVSQIAFSDDESPSKLRKSEENGQPETDPASLDQLPPNRNSLIASRQPQEPTFRRRSISRIDEKTEEETAETQSLVRRGQEAVTSTPAQTHIHDHLPRVQNDSHDGSYSFYLSPLPDFTVDQIDQPIHLELSYVAQRTQPTSLRQVHGTFALATEELIKHITEVEPFEPYWEHLRRLILRSKGLITLHKLSEFCPRLEELDVSDNDIGQLSGIPSTLRHLKIQNNCLSNLTSWGHLANLQYLDISGNELESLDGVNGLIHLRELKANDNKIRDIDGIFDLNGLLSLKLRNNNLSSINFGPAELTRLTELDLSHNRLTSIQNIENLPSLSHLDVSFNHLSKFHLVSPLTTLQSLRIASNSLQSLDAGAFPSLNLLYLDQNSLSTISGLTRCRSLEILSVREQLLSNNQNGGFFDLDLGILKDIRKVFLSSNKLSLQCLSPSTPLLSLQLLDLASCGLPQLPEDFSLKFPNVKVLNLNFNSLSSINELVGLNCLSRLSVAGNSISRMRKLCQVLSRMGRTNKGKSCSLQKVDTRGNPLTVRFYPPPITGSGRAQLPKPKSREERRAQQQAVDLDISVLVGSESCKDLLHLGGNDETAPEIGTEINDPYTLPLADALTDQKYVSHLDEATRLKRRVFELLLYAGTGGSIKILDGLEFQPSLEPGSDMDHAWAKLESLGVLKKKAITG